MKTGKEIRRTAGKVMAIAGIAGLAVVPLSAQFSFGPTWTIDPALIAKVVTETEHILKIYNTAMKTYTTASRTYTLIENNRQFITNKSMWHGSPMGIVNSFPSTGTADPSGSNIGWLNAVNKGVDSASRYANTAVTLRSNPSGVVGTWQNAHYNSAQIGQASNLAAMQTLGTVRVQQAKMSTPIANCQGASLSVNPKLNLDAVQQNIHNACQALLLQQSQAALAVDASRLELELSRSKMEADTATELANMETVGQHYAKSQAIAPGNMAAAMQGYR